MKKLNTLLILLTITICLTKDVCGQVNFGVKAGVNLSSVKFENSDSESLVAFNAGITSEINFNDKFFLRPELLYALKGWKFTEGSMNLHYLNVPVLLGYRPVSALSFLVGPEFGYLLKAVRKPEAPAFIPPYESFDYGIALGGAYNVSEDLAVELRYIHGFDTLVKANGRDVNGRTTDEIYRDGANRVFQFGLIYFFNGNG